MATNKEFILYIVDQIEGAGGITFKSMFGEYGLFSDGKLFGLVCDNKLFIKPTPSGRRFIENVTEAPPYPGAKPSFLIEKKIEDRKWLSQLIKLTVEDSPLPKPKKSKK